MEDELALGVPHVHAVEREGVEVRIDPEGAVAALDHNERPHERVVGRTQQGHDRRMLRQAIGARDVWSFAGTLCCAVVFGIACGSPVTEGDEMDGSVVLSDASAGEDANLPASSDAGSMDGPLDGAVTTDGGSAAVPDAGSVVRADAGAGPDPRFEAEMAYVTANIGRGYDTQSDVAAVFDHVGDVIGPGSGPKFIGWQEIGEGDPAAQTVRSRRCAIGSRPSGVGRRSDRWGRGRTEARSE